MTWHEWEDWNAGLYLPDYTPAQVDASFALLTHPGHFEETAREVVREWPNAARQNLINMWTGRNAWLGQASCLYAHGAPGAATREAWGRMTNDQQRAANVTAERVRNEWGRSGAETLFNH